MAKNSIATAYVQIIPTTDGIGDELDEQLGGAGEEAGKKAGGKFGSMLKKVIVAAGIGEVLKSSLSAGADLQQSFGGLETIYGDAAAAAKNYAAEAAKIGLSSNEYAEQAVSFGASLKQAFAGDTTKAVEAANTAIQDMTDNAAKMGTPIENIQNAYQGFAKQNYTMLDNLKLGYGGTKTEMERLLKDAQEISGVEYNIDNLGDVYDAIHVIQGELGLTGVAADEAATTFSGSFGAMKASAQNVLANLALGEDIKPSLNSLLDTTTTFISGNLIPMASNVISALPGALSTVITQLAPALIPAGIDLLTNLIGGIANSTPSLLTSIAALIPKMVTQLVKGLPLILGAGIKLLLGVVKAIPQIIPPLLQALPSIVSTIVSTLFNMAPQIFQATFSALGSIVKAIPSIIGSVFSAVKGVGINLVKGLWQGISDMTSWLIGKIQSFCKNALKAIKSFFGIHSPSTETAWMGEMLDAGLAKGLTDNVDMVEGAMSDVRNAALGELNPVVQGEYNVSSSGSSASNIVDVLNYYMPKVIDAARAGGKLELNGREFGRVVKAVG